MPHTRRIAHRFDRPVSSRQYYLVAQRLSFGTKSGPTIVLLNGLLGLHGQIIEHAEGHRA